MLMKSSFEHNFVIDEDLYSLTWHVVPNKHLNFEAVKGSDILKQAALNSTQNRVEFHKQEEKAWLMQISELHLEDELDLSHSLDSQIKNGLTKIISSYKPEKTKSTDVSMRIILKDDIPVYQPARHELSEILECLESTPLGDVLKGLLERFGKRFVNLVMTGLGVSNLFMERLEEVSPKLADFYSDRVADFISLFNDVADEVKKTGLFGKS
ncbi:RVP domain-containing protein [Nephila pilipes]|uniref:RVP domain-containing protein n=1 Tax=Nephila pilipes TaxID=299642 RepID=A0A8X6UUL9_NEPPI|nr:RVP domain-containing protein [Nephila pilipes]